MDYDMYDDYNDYDDDDYEQQDKYKHYFKFDPEAWDAWGKLLYEALGDIIESSPNVWYIGPYSSDKSFPVNSYISSTGHGKSFQYLGNNYYKEPIWKSQYFIFDTINFLYKNHIQQYSEYFIKQPNYYKGLFDILN